MDLPEPFYTLGRQFAIDLRGARAVFTTRRGGVSTGAYASLNLGRMTADAASAVAENRARVEAELGVPLAFLRQVHGPAVHELSRARAAELRGLPAEDLPQGDGQFTVQKGLAPAVLTADCLPVAVAGAGGVAMLHAGWRGLAEGVIGAGVGALRRAGVDGPLSAAIGPGAGGCCYEVGEALHATFADRPDHVHRGENLDLPAIARHELERAGVQEIHEIGLCTICSPRELFFSHRRDRGATGRQAGVAWSL